MVPRTDRIAPKGGLHPRTPEQGCLRQSRRRSAAWPGVSSVSVGRRGINMETPFRPYSRLPVVADSTGCRSRNGTYLPPRGCHFSSSDRYCNGSRCQCLPGSHQKASVERGMSISSLT